MVRSSLSLLCLGLSLPVAALTFQTRLEQVQWKVEGDQFECRLSQPIADFGSGEFVRKAGEQPIFRLKAGERWLGQGKATLLAAAAPWQPGLRDINLGQVSINPSNIPLTSDQPQGMRLLSGLLEGRSPLIRHHTEQGDALEVRVLPANFMPAYREFTACNSKLLPVNFQQIRMSQINFPDGIELDEINRAKLDIILDYLKADPSVNHIQLDGHSDNSGNRLANRDLSRRRALAVFDYLKSQGFPEDQITLRFHGERYPLVPNNSPANRAKNRRVTVTLSKDQPASAPSTTPNAPAAPATMPNPATAPSKVSTPSI